MFEGEEYRSYIRLCRELRLGRLFEEGDWYWTTTVHEPEGFAAVWDAGYSVERRASDAKLWLPRLDQWLAMLEEAGREQLPKHWLSGFSLYPCGGSLEYEAGCCISQAGPQYTVVAPTREEAASRLWMAVTGRTVTSG